MRKGASMQGVLVTIIIFGLALIIGAMVYRSLIEVGNDVYTKEQCRASLLLTKTFQSGADSVTFCALSVDNPVPLKCSREFLTVDDNEVLKKGKDISKVYDRVCPGGGNTCLAKNVLADQMRQCWDMFLHGEVLVFQQLEPELENWYSSDLNDRACFVCSELTMKTDVKEFTKYLRDKQLSATRSYYAFLAKNNRAICNPTFQAQYGTCWDGFGQEVNFDNSWLSWYNNETNWPGINQDSFDEGETYAVTFVRYGMEAACSSEKDGSDMPVLSVQILPAKNISAYCNAVIA